MIKPFIRHDSEVVLETRIFKVRRDRASHPDGGEANDYYVLEQPGWVNVVAITTDEQVVMVRQWRHGTRSIDLEIPAGLVDPGETPLETAARELEEETGFVSTTLEVIGEMRPNPAIQDNVCTIVLATGCEQRSAQRLDTDEDIEVVLLSYEALQRQVHDGTIHHGIVLFALYRWLDHSGRTRWPGA